MMHIVAVAQVSPFNAAWYLVHAPLRLRDLKVGSLV